MGELSQLLYTFRRGVGGGGGTPSTTLYLREASGETPSNNLYLRQANGGSPSCIAYLPLSSTPNSDATQSAHAHTPSTSDRLMPSSHEDLRLLGPGVEGTWEWVNFSALLRVLRKI